MSCQWMLAYIVAVGLKVDTGLTKACMNAHPGLSNIQTLAQELLPAVHCTKWHVGKH